MNPKAYRLPMAVLPRQYTIFLDARPGSKQFSGRVTIQIELSTPTKTIELHARDLRISAAGLTLHAQILPAAITLAPEREIALLTFAETLPPGPATLDLTFTGTISATLEGLFLSTDGPDELLCTHCEVTGARAILPCFDEPNFKARFTWQITTTADASVLTNAPLITRTPSIDGDTVTWAFATTRPISSYLLALVIGNLASTSVRIVNGVPVRIWAVAGKEQWGQFALDYTARLLPFYEDYFSFPYHFDKLDQVAVPSLGAGAMENVGLIATQQSILLLDPHTTSRRREAMAAIYIAHEFAHMWFGNLVTMKWWDDLWLNEAFATWLAYYAIHALSPEYHIWDEAQLAFDQVLEDDALARTHPIYSAVETPSAILETFDNIVYFKGAAVLRMIQSFLGDVAFRVGLQTYMREFAESNAEGDDLWRHLQHASHQPIGQLMDHWIRQPGHPLLQVTLEHVEGRSFLYLRQRHFLSGGSTDTSERIWPIPVVLRYEDGAGLHETRYLLTAREASFPLSVQDHLSWLYANADEVGFYRQHLDAPLLYRLVEHLDRLTPAEQRGLLRDQWALVTTDARSIAVYFDILSQLTRTDNPSLMSQIVGKYLVTIERLLELAGDEQALKQFRTWAGTLFREKMIALGSEPHAEESPEQVQLRARILTAMTHFAQDAAFIDLARAGQAREVMAPDSVAPDLAPVFVVATAESGNEATFDQYLGIYRHRKASNFTPEHVQRYASAFGCFQQPHLVSRTTMLLTEGAFPFQVMTRILQTMFVQPHTQVQAWEYIKAQWPVLRNLAPLMTPSIVQLTGNLAPGFRDDVATYWEKTLQGEHTGPLARALEQIDQSATIQALVEENLLAYFHALDGTQ